MRNRIRLEKVIFWALTVVVIAGIIAGSFAMAPYMAEVADDSILWIFLIAGLAILYLALNAWIAVFIYRDASRRRMNAWLWMLAVIYIPNFIGLLFYLLVRKQQFSFAETEPESTPLQCPHCGKLIHS